MIHIGLSVVISEHLYLAAAGCMYVTEHAVYMLLLSPFTSHSHFTKATVTCKYCTITFATIFVFYVTCLKRRFEKKPLAKHFQTVVTCKKSFAGVLKHFSG